MEPITRLHRCLAESRVAAGMFLQSNSPAVIELIVNGTELDFSCVDLQHVPISPADSVHVLRAIQAADPATTPVVRLPDHGVYWIQQSLDAGYMGLIVPLVESAQQARKLVRAAFFPPLGARSLAGSIRASIYGVDVVSMNDRIILLPQIESAEGLEHVEEIVATDGVNGVFMGPDDLSLSCGWHGKDPWSHKPFVDAVQRIVKACHKHDKVAAIATSAIKDARAAGFNIILFGSDMGEVRINAVHNINDKLGQVRR